MICEICKKTKAHHTHHIQSKCFGGNNKKHNLVNTCSNCHHDIHTGDIVVEGYFLTSTGLQLFWHLKQDKSITNMEDSRVYISGKK